MYFSSTHQFSSFMQSRFYLQHVHFVLIVAPFSLFPPDIVLNFSYNLNLFSSLSWPKALSYCMLQMNSQLVFLINKQLFHINPFFFYFLYTHLQSSRQIMKTSSSLLPVYTNAKALAPNGILPICCWNTFCMTDKGWRKEGEEVVTREILSIFVTVSVKNATSILKRSHRGGDISIMCVCAGLLCLGTILQLQSGMCTAVSNMTSTGQVIRV